MWEMTKEIFLGHGRVALVDDEDFDLVSQYKWYAWKAGNVRYATRFNKLDGKKKAIYMHRLILSPDVGKQVEHLNGDRLDNRRCNLKIKIRVWDKKKRVRKAKPLKKSVEVPRSDVDHAVKEAKVLDDGEIKMRIKSGDFDSDVFARVQKVTGYDEKFLMGMKYYGKGYGSVKRKSVTDKPKESAVPEIGVNECPELEAEVNG